MGRLLIQFPGTNTTKALSETLSKNVIIVDEDLHELRLHDGVTPGGHIIGGSGGISNIDDETITLNSDDEIQTVGVRNQNTANGATAVLYDWEGSLQEYIDQNIATLHPEWVCYINDDGDGGDGVYTKEETDILLAGKIDTNLNNFSYVTNCITEIPQDIKLEIGSSNQFIVKAGSKVYYGDGSSTTLSSDKSYGASTGFGNVPFIFCIKKSDLSVMQATLNNTSSNATNPGIAYRFWFNTTDGKCYMNDGSGVATETSFPVGVVQHTNNVGWTSIDQVFNGFGYIGSTVFVLPGVKGLIPNGRNADGTLNNKISYNSTTVKTITPTNGVRYICLSPYSAYADVPLTSDFYYDETKNMNFRRSDGVRREYAVCGTFTQTNSGIINFSVKTTFHAVDYGKADFVVDFREPTSANNYTWYRLYKSGWVEQGGTCAADYSGVAVTFPVSMNDGNYQFQLSVGQGQLTGTVGSVVDNRTTTGMTVYSNWSSPTQPSYICWRVSGMAAS